MSQVVAAAKGSVAAGETVRRSARRFWEVDAWRGLAITTMVIFHLVYDLWVFAGMDVVLHRGFWFYFQRFTASSFIILVGISLVISYNRAQSQPGGSKGLYWKFVRRGLKILAIAMVITLVYRYGGFGRIDFGVLHLIGTSVILAYPFLHNRWFALGTAAILMPLSYYIKSVAVDTYALVWLGFVPPNYYPGDYFPLVHWFAVVLIGVFVGHTLYGDGRRHFSLPDYSEFFPINLLRFLGRHSLTIYVIHQPILYAGLILTGVVPLRL